MHPAVDCGVYFTVKKGPFMLDVTMKSLAGEEVDLAAKYGGKVVLLVNVASACGYTRQYEGLQQLHSKYADQGLAVVGVPANDFGAQEPGTDAEIGEFCRKNYGVEFDILSKVSILGPEKTELYQRLTSEESNPGFAGDVQWNFEKFLIGRNGQVAGRYPSKVEPLSEELTGAIEAELNRK